MPQAHTGARAQTVRVYLRHHNDPDGKFTPTEARCETNEEKHRVGCGATIKFFITFPNGKRMPFDGEPRVVEGSEVQIGDGGIVASVFTDNVHFATCTARPREKPAPATSANGRDFKQAAGGND